MLILEVYRSLINFKNVSKYQIRTLALLDSEPHLKDKPNDFYSLSGYNIEYIMVISVTMIADLITFSSFVRILSIIVALAKQPTVCMSSHVVTVIRHILVKLRGYLALDSKNINPKLKKLQPKHSLVHRVRHLSQGSQINQLSQTTLWTLIM